jgi:hypothetical protein
MGDCMMFTDKLVLCQYCKPVFEAMFSHETLDFIGDSGWFSEQINNLLRCISIPKWCRHPIA